MDHTELRLYIYCSRDYIICATPTPLGIIICVLYSIIRKNDGYLLSKLFSLKMKSRALYVIDGELNGVLPSNKMPLGYSLYIYGLF